MSEGFTAFAEFQFRLGTKQKDDATLRQHLEAYEKRNGRPHPMMEDAPELPPECKMLWRDFMDLHLSRGMAMGGPMRITFQDIDAWQRVTGNRLEPWELRAIKSADAAYFEVRAENDK